jgi:chromosome partitioning protein
MSVGPASLAWVFHARPRRGGRYDTCKSPEGPSMPVYVIANPKGGVGKSTLATNLAGWFARQGRPTMLGDTDRQQSSRRWLALRPDVVPHISGWSGDLDDGIVRPPKGTTHVVLDTPAGLHGKRLDLVMKLADTLIVPLQPSLFDIQATHDFVQQLQGSKRHDKVRIALVGMRVREHTISNDQLHAYLAGLPAPTVTYLRDTQNYVHVAAHGLTLWDVAPSRVERDLEQWQPLTRWVDAQEQEA